MWMNIHIRNYKVDSVIMVLGSNVNMLTKQTWQKMGEPRLGWSPVQLRLANQTKVQPIGRVSNLVVDVEGTRAHPDFDVIKFIDGGVSYLVLLWIGWANYSMDVINFKKWLMTFENQDIRVIAPMDPNEGR